ncbi:hypothetical protein D3875_02905 [Deinococcus cavernae]|uniref:Uncharacterized protein n=1 Tax=Deinococcus cavernae TaxID=2320857 RepID=A0A418VFP3_9DEIO|nr:hypothetical protein [Deinococcus cavernae]RJF74962.1 hypothetical protein D3875_02905 [Deinococcus cavernae]
MTHPGSAVTYGPSPGEGFIVLEGIAVVMGLGRTFTICAGGCWPGTGLLPPELFGALRPSEVLITPGTRLSHHPQSPREIEFALSSLRAQLLRSGRTDDRLDMLEDTLGTWVSTASPWPPSSTSRGKACVTASAAPERKMPTPRTDPPLTSEPVHNPPPTRPCRSPAGFFTPRRPPLFTTPTTSAQAAAFWWATHLAGMADLPCKSTTHVCADRVEVAAGPGRPLRRIWPLEHA